MSGLKIATMQPAIVVFPASGLRLHVEVVAHMSPEERQIVRALPEGMILKHNARRWQRQAASG